MNDHAEQFDAILNDEAFVQLVLRHLDGCATREESQRLFEVLERDNARLRIFTALSIQACEVAESITPRQHMADELAADDTESMSLMAEVLAIEEQAAQRRAIEAEQQRQAAEEIERAVPTTYTFDTTPVRHIVIPRAVAYSTLAAVAAMFVMLVYLIMRPAPIAPGPDTLVQHGDPAPVVAMAKLTRAVGVAWDGSTTPSIGHALDSAKHHTLQQGVVELTFQTGSVALVEAPARFRILDGNRMELVYGRLTGNVPPSGVGFTVHTPAAVIIDHGTEFGIHVDAANPNATKVHVFQGAVAVAPRHGDTQATLLSTGQATRAEAGRLTPLSGIDRTFLRAMPSPYELAVRQSDPLCYWRLGDASPDGRITDAGRAGADAWLPRGARFVYPGALINDRDAAVAFDEEHHGVHIGMLPNFAQGRPFTVEAWVRPSADLMGNCRVISNRDTMGGFAVGIAGRNNTAQAPFMSLMLNVYEVNDYASVIPLPGDTWTHIAVTVDETGRPCMYFNGRQVDLLVRNSSYIPFDQAADAKRIAIDKPSTNPFYLADNPPQPADVRRIVEAGAFQGQLDEVAVYDRALTPQEIASHYAAAVTEK